jgi:hypothetical protein
MYGPQHLTVDSKMLRHKDVMLLNVHNMSSYRGPQSVNICVGCGSVAEDGDTSGHVGWSRRALKADEPCLLPSRCTVHA